MTEQLKKALREAIKALAHAETLAETDAQGIGLGSARFRLEDMIDEAD